jgi:hypothetical protein
MNFQQQWEEKQMNTKSQFQYTANTSSVAKLLTLLKPILLRVFHCIFLKVKEFQIKVLIFTNFVLYVMHELYEVSCTLYLTETKIEFS